MTFFDDVVAFHVALGVPVAARPQDFLPWERYQLRCRLVDEEVAELLAAMVDGDIAHIAKEIADVVVVVLGTAVEYGIPMNEVWAAVHESNMAKRPAAGVPVMRADGKVLKPDGWLAPDVAGIVNGAQAHHA